MSNTKKDKLPRKDLKVVGELYIGYMMTIYRDLDGNFYTFAKAETGVSEDIADKLVEFPWKERTLYLMDPWRELNTMKTNLVIITCVTFMTVFISTYLLKALRNS